MILYLLVGLGILACAILSISARRLLISAIWLALTSALVAVMIYLLGAPHIAVIELSVGAGLVTVLFVFAINIAGEDTSRLKSIIPTPVAIFAVVLAVVLGLVLILRANVSVALTAPLPENSAILWQSRYVDLLLQVVLIFAGVLGVIGLLAEKVKPHREEETE
ncbi:MAG TPA: NADH-quinone oxidoreductase subunit J [Anaerolineaceae bacterium]|nr:NADH-quinone oxidoreductase subunit J [Anaerolineaceae bacterium]